MKIKGVTPGDLHLLAGQMGFKLDNERSEGRFHAFVLRMATHSAVAPDAPYRKRGFSGRRTVAVCFHGHRAFYERVFSLNPDALIVTSRRRWTSLEDLNEHASEVGAQNVGSQFNPQAYAEQCECGGW